MKENPLKRYLSVEQFANIAELQQNPFRYRVAKVFAKNNKIGFEEFVDFLSVFSEEATRDVKSFYAFKIYGIRIKASVNKGAYNGYEDIDDDTYLGRDDMTAVVKVQSCFHQDHFSKKTLAVDRRLGTLGSGNPSRG